MGKKHIRPEDHVGYTTPYALFDPLSATEQADIGKGRSSFETRNPGVLLFPDPFVTRTKCPRTAFLSDLQIVFGRTPFCETAARTLATAIREQWQVDVPLLPADTPGVSLQTPAPLLLIGGAENHPLSLVIARRHQAGLFCANFPGPGGWGVTTHWELEDGDFPRYILSCDADTLQPAIRAFLQAGVAKEGGRQTLAWVHRVSPAKTDHPWEGNYATWLSRNSAKYPLVQDWIGAGRSRSYREVFCDFFQQDFQDGLPYNASLIDIGIDAIRYFQFTGDEQALDLFREMMWGFWNYLQSDHPQVYISDMDFRIGNLCVLWNWIEHSPFITPEERSVFPKLLLGALRIVKDYFHHKWKTKPGPHNHQTFKARSLILGWRYFRNWDLPDVNNWKQDADGVFAPIDPRAFKHRENAGRYEVFIPEHTLVWLEVNGRTVSPEVGQSLSKFAQREWAARDPFLFPLDYGDCDPEFQPHRPLQVAPWLNPENDEQAELLGMEQSSGNLFPFAFPSPVDSFPGLTIGLPDRPFRGPVGWLPLPLDPLLERSYPVSGDPDQRFDKLIWRDAWKPEATYLALEGFGNSSVSHAHNEVNGILRLNLAGRIWLVSNGYGKLPGISDAAKAYRTRQVGPAEHNMLVIRNPDGGCFLPPVNALLTDLASTPLPFSMSELSPYGGVHWTRHVFLIPQTGCLFIDRVQSLQDDPLPVEVQWNVLGDRTETDRGASFEQSGTTLIFDHFGTAQPAWAPSPITAWRNAIKEGAYPHTKSLPTHGILRTGEGDLPGRMTHDFVSGFWLKDSIVSSAWDPVRRVCSVQTLEPLTSTDSSSTRSWGHISLRGTHLEILLR